MQVNFSVTDKLAATRNATPAVGNIGASFTSVLAASAPPGASATTQKATAPSADTRPVRKKSDAEPSAPVAVAIPSSTNPIAQQLVIHPANTATEQTDAEPADCTGGAIDSTPTDSSSQDLATTGVGGLSMASPTQPAIAPAAGDAVPASTEHVVAGLFAGTVAILDQGRGVFTPLNGAASSAPEVDASTGKTGAAASSNAETPALADTVATLPSAVAAVTLPLVTGQEVAQQTLHSISNSGKSTDEASTSRTIAPAGRKVSATNGAASKRSTDGIDASSSSPTPKATDEVSQIVVKSSATAGGLTPDPGSSSPTAQHAVPTTVTAIPSTSVDISASPQPAVKSTPLTEPTLPQPSATPGETSAATLTPALSSAQLIQTMHQSEMRLGMNSAEFGNISISTSLTRQSISAQISLDHGDLGRALALQLPAMQEKLGSTYGLQAHVQIHNNSLSSNSDTNGSASGRRQEQPASPASTSRLGVSGTASLFEGALSIPTLTPTPALGSSRLDITI